MIDDSSPQCLDSDALPTPGWPTRMRFFVRCHPATFATAGGLFVGGGGAFLVVLTSGFGFAGNGPLFVASMVTGFTALLTGFMPLFITRGRAANVSEIAAALGNATLQERLRLASKIEARLASRIWSTPMSIFQLVVLFGEVRAEHGDRARQKRLVDKRTEIEQERFYGQLKGFVGEPDGQGGEHSDIKCHNRSHTAS